MYAYTLQNHVFLTIVFTFFDRRGRGREDGGCGLQIFKWDRAEYYKHSYKLNLPMHN